MLSVRLEKDVPDVVVSLSGNLDMMTGEVLQETIKSLDSTKCTASPFPSEVWTLLTPQE